MTADAVQSDQTTPDRTLSVEIWSDVVCPWCAIGRARFDQALARFDRGDQVEVRWRSFELDPTAPAEREGPYTTMLAQKYGTSVDQAQAMIDRMVDQAADEGLDFDFSVARPGNTFDAHRVLHLAAERGLQHEVKDRFLRGYHSEGEAIGLHDVLTRLAVEAGLDEVEVKEVLTTDAYSEAVRADEEQAREYGISGVPFFVLGADGSAVDRPVGVSGAQPPEAILEALHKAFGAPAPAFDLMDGAADACGIDGC